MSLTIDRRLIETAARQCERLITYAHTCGTVDTDNRDEARQCLAELRAVLASAGASDPSPPSAELGATANDLGREEP